MSIFSRINRLRLADMCQGLRRVMRTRREEGVAKRVSHDVIEAMQLRIGIGRHAQSVAQQQCEADTREDRV